MQTIPASLRAPGGPTEHRSEHEFDVFISIMHEHFTPHRPQRIITFLEGVGLAGAIHQIELYAESVVIHSERVLPPGTPQPPLDLGDDLGTRYSKLPEEQNGPGHWQRHTFAPGVPAEAKTLNVGTGPGLVRVELEAEIRDRRRNGVE